LPGEHNNRALRIRKQVPQGREALGCRQSAIQQDEIRRLQVHKAARLGDIYGGEGPQALRFAICFEKAPHAPIRLDDQDHCALTRDQRDVRLHLLRGA